MPRPPGRKALLLAFAVLALAAPGCTGPAGEPVPAYYPLPDFELTNHLGAAYGSEQLRGKVWVADFIFTGCQSICPVMTRRMAELQTRLERHPSWDDIRLVSFSVDPENDTVEVLREHARDAGAVDGRWSFLTGPREAIWELSRDGFKLAVGEAEDPGMPIFHSQRWALVDRAGRVRGYYDSLDPEGIRDLLRDLDAVLAEPAGGTAG